MQVAAWPDHAMGWRCRFLYGCDHPDSDRGLDLELADCRVHRAAERYSARLCRLWWCLVRIAAVYAPVRSGDRLQHPRDSDAVQSDAAVPRGVAQGRLAGVRTDFRLQRRRHAAWCFLSSVRGPIRHHAADMSTVEPRVPRGPWYSQPSSSARHSERSRRACLSPQCRRLARSSTRRRPRCN